MDCERIEVLNRTTSDGDAFAFKVTTHYATTTDTALLCDTRSVFADIGGSSKLYAINLNQVECLVGEWNKDKTEYGIRVFYASGNSVWIGNSAAKKLIERLNYNDYNGIQLEQLKK